MSKLLINLTKRSSSISNEHRKKQSDNNGQIAANLFKQEKLSENMLKKASNDELNFSRPPKSPIVNSEGHSGYSMMGSSNAPSSLADDIIIKEEISNDCVYQVQIKKVYNKNMLGNESASTNKSQTGTYKPFCNLSAFDSFQSYMNEPSTTNRPSSNDGLVYTRIKTKQLKYASLTKFVDHLLDQQTGELDLNLVQTFFATYRTFSNGVEIIKELRRLYEQVLPASLDMTEDVRLNNLKSIRSVCAMWLNNYTEDFNEPPEYSNLREMNKFADAHFADYYELRKKIKEKLEQFNSENNSKSILSNHKRSQSSLTNSSLTNFNSLISLDEKFMSIESNYFAEQLTYVDKCLFQKVCAHQCLGAVWSTRYQKTVKQNTLSNLTLSTNSVNEKFASIRAFIDQFNCVSFYVQATILEKVDLKPHERAKIICKWIEIAQACKKYQNYSSLNAIVQGLNTQCVSRLQKTWDEVPFDLKQKLNELTEIFSQDQNQKLFRDILMKELKDYMVIFESKNEEIDGINYKNLFNKSEENVTNAIRFKLNNKYVDYELDDSGKYADINSGINATLSRKMREKIFMPQTKKKLRESFGTVPFLGTFLKDLEYIHAQMPTKTEKGLINVLKKRKEFEIIAQIKLFQQASFLYKIRHDPNFNIWLHQQPVYSEHQNYEFSYKIEPKTDPDSNLKDFCLRKTKISSSHGSRSESVESMNSLSVKTRSSNLNLNAGDRVAVHSRNSSFDNSEVILNLKAEKSSSPAITNLRNGDQKCNNNSLDMSNNIFLTVNNKYNNKSSDIRVKVNIELNDWNNDFKKNEQISSVIYKSLLISDKYRTKDVKRLILDKFFLNPDLCDQFCLVQILNNSNSTNSSQTTNELVINDNCNVFYAAKSMPYMQFVLRKRPDSAKLNGALLNDTNKNIHLSSQNRKIINKLPHHSPNCPNPYYFQKNEKY